MADNTIKTKILLACDTLANWTGSTRVLSKGEIALAITTDNKVQVRVGNGTTFANSLPIDISELASTLTLNASQVKIDGSETTVKAAIEALQGDVSTLQSKVNTLNGDASTAGSVAKSIADALKAYTATSVLTATYATKAELTAEITSETQAREAADTALSTAIDNKILIKEFTSDTYVSAKTLKIATVSPEKYSQLLDASAITSSDLYIVSSDHLYGYNKPITNVGDGISASDAATVGQLSTVSAALNAEIDSATAISSLSGDVAAALANTFDAKGAAATAKSEAIAAAEADATTKADNALTAAKAYTDEEIGKVNTSLTAYDVTVEKQATAETGYAATYIVKQGGISVGAPINIPKDFLVKSGTVETCSAENSPVAGYKVGDKYLDFIVNTTDDSATAQHIYIKLTDLVDVYTAAPGATQVQIAISDKNVVSATLVDGGVTTAKIADANVTVDKLAADSVTTAKIKDANVTADKLAANSVTTDKIADTSITQAKLSGEFVFDCGNATA